jgi:hypothetical protein
LKTPPRCRIAALATLVAAVCSAAPAADARLVDPPLPAVDGPEAEEPAQATEPKPGGSAAADEPAPKPSPPPSFPKMILLDVEHVLTVPFHWTGRQWGFLAAVTATTGVVSVADKSVSDSVRAHGTTLGFAGDTLEGMGDGRSFVLLGGFFLAVVIGHDSKAKNVFVDGLAASLIASAMITPAISTVVGRERPTAEQGAFEFRPFNGRSFPSGHATQAFAVASVIATSYDQAWVKVASYGAAAVGAYARIRRGKHFPSDVVAGAMIGTAVGRAVVHFNRDLRSAATSPETPPEARGARLTCFPVLDGRSLGFTATLDF